MLDKNLIFDAGTVAITADGDSSSVQVGPGTYVVECIVQAITAADEMIPTVQESDDDSTWNDHTVLETLTNSKKISSREVKTDKEYLRIHWDINASATMKIHAGIASAESSLGK